MCICNRNRTSSNEFQLHNPCLFYFEYLTDPPDNDSRIVYPPETKQVWIIAIGHRYIPDDFYD